MRTEYLAAIAIAALSAGAAYAVYSVKTDDYCPQPSAASVAALFAPCQAFDTAMGRSVTKQDAVRMGLLRPDEQPGPAPQKQEPSPAQLIAQDFQILAQERATSGVAR
jgi:hypothetical protein